MLQIILNINSFKFSSEHIQNCNISDNLKNIALIFGRPLTSISQLSFAETVAFIPK